MILEPCDIFFTRGDSLFAYLIRRATRKKNEAPTWAGHVGCVVAAGEGYDAVVVEALATVDQHPMREQYESAVVEIRVYRPLSLSDEQKAKILSFLISSVGERYGYLKIALHGLYWLTGCEWVLNFSFIKSRPICSYLVANAWAAAGLTFGMGFSKVPSPDDMMDWCVAHPEKYELIATYNQT